MPSHRTNKLTPYARSRIAEDIDALELRATIAASKLEACLAMNAKLEAEARAKLSALETKIALLEAELDESP